MIRLRVALLLVSALFVFGCQKDNGNSDTTPPPANPQEGPSPSPTPTPEPTSTPEPTPVHALRNGFWGRADARLEVKNTGARLELGCAHGDIKQRILLDAHDSFSIMGTYTPEGGPEPRDGRPSVPARYIGHVTGDFAADILHLTVIVNQSSTLSFDLTYGESRMPIKCL